MSWWRKGIVCVHPFRIARMLCCAMPWSPLKQWEPLKTAWSTQKSPGDLVKEAPNFSPLAWPLSNRRVCRKMSGTPIWDALSPDLTFQSWGSAGQPIPMSVNHFFLGHYILKPSFFKAQICFLVISFCLCTKKYICLLFCPCSFPFLEQGVGIKREKLAMSLWDSRALMGWLPKGDLTQLPFLREENPKLTLRERYSPRSSHLPSDTGQGDRSVPLAQDILCLPLWIPFP